MTKYQKRKDYEQNLYINSIHNPISPLFTDILVPSIPPGTILEVALFSADLGIATCHHTQLLVLKYKVVLLFPFHYLPNSIFLRMCHSLQSYTQLILKRTTQKRAPKASYSFLFQVLTIKLRTVMLEVENHRSFIFCLSRSELSM